MDELERRCANCGRPLPPIDTSEAGPLALKLLNSLVCERCELPDDPEHASTIEERRLKSGIPATGPISFDNLSSRFSLTSVEVAMRWSAGEFPLLTLFGRGSFLPDDLAVDAAIRRLELGGVRWLSAGDPEDRETALTLKGTGAAIVLADIDQASLIKNSMSETNPIITYRQRYGLPLLLTSSVSAKDLARSAGEPLVHRLRAHGKAVHVVEKDES